MRSKLVYSLFLISAPLFAEARLEKDPVEVPSPIEKVFIPAGFDDNDNIEVVLHGNFPNTCYTVGHASAKVDTEKREVIVKATSYKYPGKVCLQTITPFIQTINLGVIPEGTYQVRSQEQKKILKTLEVVRRKTESPDEFLYASVENASLQVDPETGKESVKVSGHFPYFFIGCMVLRDVRTRTAPSDVLIVQPIAEIVDNEECLSQNPDKSFEYTAGLPEAFVGEGLLHVRTLNGNSINRYINIPKN